MIRRLISFLSGFFSRRQISFVILLLASCLITVTLEYFADKEIQSGNPRDPGLAPSVFEMSAIYQRVVASGPRQPVSTFTAIVEIDPKKDPSLHNVCVQRKFVAELIRALVDFSAAVIVIDKYYPTKCGEQDEGTIALQRALKKFGLRVPIVIGRRVNDAATGGSEKLVWNSLVPSPEFGEEPGIHEGIVNIDPDTKRLPLGWTVFDGGKRQWRRSLALAASEAYDPKLRIKYPFLDKLIAERQHPYISFLNQDQLRRYATYSTSAILCGSETTRAARSCPADLKEDLSYLRGRIVLIGERDMDADSHFSVIGHVPGFVLQANYIEALLDQRYFKPVGWWTNYGAGFLIFLAFHWVLIKHQHALEAADAPRVPWLFVKAAFWCLVVILATIAALYLIVMHAGLYVNPATMGVVAFFMKFAELIFGVVPRGAGGEG